MVNEDVAYYLREGRKRGFGFVVLKKKLLEGGYGNKDIDEAIELIKENEKLRK